MGPELKSHGFSKAVLKQGGENTMSKKMGLYLSVALASAVTCGMLSPVQADSNGVVAAERVIWNSTPKSTAWVEELIQPLPL